VAKFDESQDFLGSIPERIAKEKIGIVGKGTNKLHIGKP
jgi:folylpolyglutamate synthase/dihydropteroate synthase